MRLFLILGTALILTGCAKSTPAMLPQIAAARSQPTVTDRVASNRESLPDLTYRIIDRFGYEQEGGEPVSLTLVNGELYGVTTEGGGTCFDVPCGRIFKLTMSGHQQIIYTFRGESDGSYPQSGLVNINGALYGATSAGGGSTCGYIGCGTIFKVTTTGEETVLYRFAGGSDGASPYTTLVAVDGVLYGATLFGGGSNACPKGPYYAGCGTVFKVTTSGTESILHRFEGGADGGWPEGNLLNVNGKLYSTTYFGGTGVCGGYGCGTIYEISPSGDEKRLYAFKGGADGSAPDAGLTDLEGVLYGTTSTGGGTGCDGAGCGTVFKATTAGAEEAIYAFKGGEDGAQPLSSLTKVGTDLYGTTEEGGTGNCPGLSSNPGCGTIFKIAGNHAESLIYSFRGGEDGAYPFSAPLYLKGRLYGVTTFGGGTGCEERLGCGTAFYQSL